jgi:hypothetical protein
MPWRYSWPVSGHPDHVAARIAQGPDSLGDRRKSNGAAPVILTPEALSSLKERLKAPPSQSRGRRRSCRAKKLQDVAAEEKLKHPEAVIEIWAMDEHRIGLKPIMRRIWAPKGERPIAPGPSPLRMALRLGLR